VSDEQPIFLFSYGTLQQPEVQQALFGRVLDTHLDVLPGHALSWLHITNLAVIAQSGRDRHPILTPSPEPHAAVTGSVMRLTSAELEQARPLRSRRLPSRLGHAGLRPAVLGIPPATPDHSRLSEGERPAAVECRLGLPDSAGRIQRHQRSPIPEARTLCGATSAGRTRSRSSPVGDRRAVTGLDGVRRRAALRCCPLLVPVRPARAAEATRSLHATAVPSSSTIWPGIASRVTPSIVVVGATPAAPNLDASTP